MSQGPLGYTRKNPDIKIRDHSLPGWHTRVSQQQQPCGDSCIKKKKLPWLQSKKKENDRQTLTITASASSNKTQPRLLAHHSCKATVVWQTILYQAQHTPWGLFRFRLLRKPGRGPPVLLLLCPQKNKMGQTNYAITQIWNYLYHCKKFARHSAVLP